MKTIVKILAVLALVACVVTLFSACNSEGDDDEEDAFCVTYKNVEIKLGKSADNVDKLGGSPISAGNCGKGALYQYKFNDIVIEVLESEDGKKTVDKIDFLNDTLTTSKGVCIGDSSDKVVSAHGTPAQQTNSKIEYKDGNLSLVFVLENGNVSEIKYRHNTNGQ